MFTILELWKAWRKVPYLRLGQLLVNAQPNELFYREDDELIQDLARLIKPTPQQIHEKENSDKRELNNDAFRCRSLRHSLG
jgi:hypothetical protein